MRNPNGFGNITKLSGKRRNPWRVRKTLRWEIDPVTGKQKQVFQNIGYYPTRAAAMEALSNFNANPYDVGKDITFADIYDKWSREKFSSISDSNIKGYKASYAVCHPLYNMKFGEIRKSHLQGVVDNCGKNYPTLRKLKVLFNQLYTYAMQNDVCSKDYSEFVDIAKYKDKNTIEKHTPFTDSEINKLWDSTSRNEYVSVILMLMYSGVRISELLNLKKTDVHLNERYFDVVESKTESGIRKVPIAEKTLPFFERWMDESQCDYLICSIESGSHLAYKNYYNHYWQPLMLELGMNHLPHDTRHTTISMLARAEVNQTIIKRIVGHAGAMNLTEKVYTHFDVNQLIEAIDKI
ncbi:MAG: tyrosine-type recombinase/integrase [Clostridiales bacterium]|nr:tyrosine-type recombinase/integrase [Clostridiales bacterium]